MTTDFVLLLLGLAAGLGGLDLTPLGWADLREEYGSAVAGLGTSGRRERPDGRMGAEESEAPWEENKLAPVGIVRVVELVVRCGR